jgi:Na+-driven multidrug efflux pump
MIALVSRSNADSIALSTAFFGAITVGLSIAAILIALFSYVPMRVGRIVYEQYGRVTAKSAEAAQGYLRLVWWRSLALSSLFALGCGIALYLIMDPALRDLRQRDALTKSDLQEERLSVSRDLDRLKKELEQKISAVKAP